MLVNIHEAKTHLSRLIQAVLDGEEVVIAKSNRPLVRLVVVDSARSERVLGTAKGVVNMSDDFDAPIPDFADHT